jgi:polar amino acid transport system substrate-binding protein
MNKSKLFACVAAASVLLAACGGAATPAANSGAGGDAPKASATLPDLKGREIVIAVENAYPPFNSKDEKTGEGVGIDYDFFNEACKRMNCKVKFVTTSWDAIVAVMGGSGKAEWDVAADGITITDERKKNVDFSDPYVKVSMRLMVRKGEDRFKDSGAFKGNTALKFGAQQGTTNYDLMEKLVGKDRIVVYDQFGLIVEALKNKDIDATVMDDVASAGYLSTNNDAIEILPEELVGEELGLVYSKGSDLREPFNKALAEMKSDGTWVKIVQKYIPSYKL